MLAGCCKFLDARILCVCICTFRCGHNVLTNLQQDKYYSLFFSFLSLYEWGKCYAFKDKSLENGLPCIFQVTGNIIL